VRGGKEGAKARCNGKKLTKIDKTKVNTEAWPSRLEEFQKLGL
jgi:hypothetical protein